MCAYYVEIMCAGRIGLGWAHDVFTFACHMFMHFSCICTIFFILLILNVLVLFYLSLSLSLFLSVSCSMAPKQKSTPSWNPLRFGASSSSPSANSIPFHVRFHNEKARTDFLEKFSWLRFSNPDHSLNHKRERFKVFEVEPRSNRGRTVAKTNSCFSSVRHLHLRVTVKTPLARVLQKVQGSLIWWWHLFYIPCLTITPLQSLVLDFCYPFLRDSL